MSDNNMIESFGFRLKDKTGGRFELLEGSASCFMCINGFYEGCNKNIVYSIKGYDLPLIRRFEDMIIEDLSKDKISYNFLSYYHRYFKERIFIYNSEAVSSVSELIRDINKCYLTNSNELSREFLDFVKKSAREISFVQEFPIVLESPNNKPKSFIESVKEISFIQDVPIVFNRSLGLMDYEEDNRIFLPLDVPPAFVPDPGILLGFPEIRLRRETKDVKDMVKGFNKIKTLKKERAASSLSSTGLGMQVKAFFDKELYKEREEEILKNIKMEQPKITKAEDIIAFIEKNNNNLLSLMISNFNDKVEILRRAGISNKSDFRIELTKESSDNDDFKSLLEVSGYQISYPDDRDTTTTYMIVKLK